MVRSIPAGIQSAMRADGVQFVGDDAGLNALLADLGGSTGVVVRARSLPTTAHRIRLAETLSVETHPFLTDHAIDGNPVLPLASAAAMLAESARLNTPFELTNLTLFKGIVPTEPVHTTTLFDKGRAELRAGADSVLSYKASLQPITSDIDVPTAHTGGDAPSLSLTEFYDDVTFHGPLLQGITAIDGIGDNFVRGRVKTSRPSDWIPATDRTGWFIDPLALDSAMQLSAYVAWTRFGRAGTPVSIERYIQLKPWPQGELNAEVTFGEGTGDRFSGTITLRDQSGEAIAIAENVVAQLSEFQSETDTTPLEDFEIKPQWPEYKELRARIDGVASMGLQNPYFDLHQGTARDTTLIDGREIINFSSYNYIGLSGDARIRADVNTAMERYGTSVSASRVASGERPFHRDLERGLADALGVQDAIAFPSGHATNVTTIGHLFGPNDLILHDELIHDSCLQGAKLAGSARRGFRHDDPDHVEEQLRELRRHYEKVLILVEGVYSMDGDVTNLPQYLELKKKYGCMLMIDEAHSFGTIGKTGRGISEHFGIDANEVDIWMGTLSKSMASMGGFIAGSKALVEYLRYTTPGFVFAAGMTPTIGQAALSALGLMFEEPWRITDLQKNCQFFYDALNARGIDTGLAIGQSPVVPAITGDSMQALLLSEKLLEQGINAKPIIFPAVADDSARLRFFITSLHNEEQLTFTADCIANTLAAIRRELAS
jgi:8-amino-7-oxononanoate synthase